MDIHAPVNHERHEVSVPARCTRTSSQELLNGLANQVSHAQAFLAPETDSDDPRLLHLKVDDDDFRVLPTLPVATGNLRHVLDGRLAGRLPHWHRPPERDGVPAYDHGHGGYVQLLQRQCAQGACGHRLPPLLRSLLCPCKFHPCTYHFDLTLTVL